MTGDADEPPQKPPTSILLEEDVSRQVTAVIGINEQAEGLNRDIARPARSPTTFSFT